MPLPPDTTTDASDTSSDGSPRRSFDRLDGIRPEGHQGRCRRESEPRERLAGEDRPDDLDLAVYDARFRHIGRQGYVE
jgi:hypothetical protein